MKEGNSFGVDVEGLVPASTREHQWAQPSHAHLRRLMRLVYTAHVYVLPTPPLLLSRHQTVVVIIIIVIVIQGAHVVRAFASGGGGSAGTKGCAGTLGPGPCGTQRGGPATRDQVVGQAGRGPAGSHPDEVLLQVVDGVVVGCLNYYYYNYGGDARAQEDQDRERPLISALASGGRC